MENHLMTDKDDKTITGNIVPITQIGDTEYQVKLADYNAFMEGKGVTREMRDQLAAAHTELQGDLLKFAGKQVCGQKDPATKVTVEVQTAKGSTFTVGVQGKTVHRKPQDGSEVTNYGSCSLRISQTIPLPLRKEGGVVEDIGAACQKKFGK
jgi:hypothetical protein